jgi:hypothetical protein
MIEGIDAPVLLAIDFKGVVDSHDLRPREGAHLSGAEAKGGMIPAAERSVSADAPPI